MEEVTARLAAGDVEALRELLGENAASAEALGAVFGSGGYEPARGPSEVGTVGDATRWVIPVSKRAAPRVAVPVPAPEGGGLELPDPEPGVEGQAGETGEPSPAGEERVFLDLVPVRDADGTIRWKVKDLHLPPALQELADAADPAAAAERSQQDAMVVADTFITAVTRKDFVTALRICDGETVPEEKIAGLCIVFEEGQLALRKERPLVATALGDEKAWVIAHVESPKLDEGSEFGLIMRRDAEGEWHIAEINFGKLLETYVAASEAGKVPYTPIKAKPGAGELLVLYFEYDDAELLPRARRQVGILAGILKADPGKILTIAGHADALGSEDYNARLSATRAQSVKLALVDFDVPETQVRTTGFGEAKPWKPNERPDGSDNPAGRAHNRRAELFLDFSGS
jgi:hypothetical protein